MPLPDGGPAKIALALAREGRDESHHAWVRDAPLPPWMQTHVGPTRLEDAEIEDDGTSLARGRRLLVLVDRDRHAEIALDFSAPTPDPRVDAEVTQPALISQFGLVGSRRVGSLVIVHSGEPDGRLLGVDATTGEIAWQTRPGLGPWFAIAGDHAITSAQSHGRWSIVAVALDTGAIDATVATKHGAYRFWQATPGEIHGTWIDDANGRIADPIEVVVRVMAGR